MAAGPSAAALNAAANAVAALIDTARLHTGDPGASGTSNTTTAGVQTIAWGSASNGDITMTGTENFTGGAASGACTWISLWDGDPGSGGVWFWNLQLTGDQTFNAAGEYTLDSLVLDFD